ncbi:MAG: 5-(carboxyamino)imidazole ribonucleotide synthase [Chitinophagaceae bacterium]|nr:5-(carboxyamino)imidazole ribonucleotide synthase [Chitinophagaceae bacterium]
MSLSFFSGPAILGILGGGQLGKMLLQAGHPWDLQTRVLDPDPEAPCKNLCHYFEVGSLLDYNTVYQFGKACDVLTIEIEHVNTDALRQLKKEGVVVHPDPEALGTIQDKGKQKIFFKHLGIPTSDFSLFQEKEHLYDALRNKIIKYPFVQKTRTAGYDGKGVSIIFSENDLPKLLEGPCIIEDYVPLQGELAVIVARNEQGETVAYDPVSMDFHAEANLLDLLLYPAPVSVELAAQAEQYARAIIESFGICGVLAVEFLIDQQGKIWVNEVAPRPHNSGHQTIESSVTSQYQQHLRGILNLPLGSTRITVPSAMVNILGDEGHQGPVLYEGLNTCLEQPGIHIHLYGKKITKPFRKMGHVTVTHPDLEQAKQTAQWVKQTIHVQSRK